MEKNNILKIVERLLGVSFYLLAVGVCFSNAVAEIGTTLVIMLWLVKKIITKDTWLTGGFLSVLLLIVVAWNIASFINTSYLYESIRGFLKVAKHALLFIAAIDYFNSKERLRPFLIFTLVFAFFICLNGIVQYITGTDLIRQNMINLKDVRYRVSSSFKHSNDFGAYIIVILTMLMSLFFSTKRLFKERILVLLVMLPVLWCLITTSSRGAWLGFITALLFLFAIKSKRIMAIILIVLFLSPFIMPDSVKNKFSDFTTVHKKEGTVWERTRLWSGAAAMVKEHPVVGFGANTYTKNFPKYKPADYPDVIYTHNSYLHMAAEIGAVGAGIFLLFLISLILSTGKGILKFDKGLMRDLSLGLWAGVIGFLAHCTVDTHLYSVTLSAFIFLYMGILVSVRNIAYEEY